MHREQMHWISHDVGEEVSYGNDEATHHGEIDVSRILFSVFEYRLAQNDVDGENCRAENCCKIASKHVVF